MRERKIYNWIGDPDDDLMCIAGDYTLKVVDAGSRICWTIHLNGKGIINGDAVNMNAGKFRCINAMKKHMKKVVYVVR